MADYDEVLLAEYETLRAESIATKGNRLQIVAFAVAGVGALLAGVLSIDDPVGRWKVVLAVTCVGIPAMALGSLLVWLGEFERMCRAGYYIRVRIESHFTRTLPGQPEFWETWLLSQRLGYPYVISVALLWGGALSGPLIGTSLIKPQDGMFAFGWLAWLSIAACVAAAYFVGKRGLAIRKLNTQGGPVPPGTQTTASASSSPPR